MSQQDLDTLLTLLGQFQKLDKKYIYDQFIGMDILQTDQMFIDNAVTIVTHYRDMDANDMRSCVE